MVKSTSKKEDVTFNDCFLSAAMYHYKSEWREKEPEIYKVAQYQGWLKDCTKHMIQTPAGHKKEYSFEKCKDMYLSSAGAQRWVIEHPDTFFFAKSKGWLRDIGLTERQSIVIPSYSEALDSALTCESTKEWRLEHSGIYKFCIKFGWKEPLIALIKSRMIEAKKAEISRLQDHNAPKYKLQMVNGSWSRIEI